VKVQDMPLGMFGSYLGIFRLYRKGAEYSCRQQRRQRRDLCYHHLSRFLKYRTTFLTQKRYFGIFSSPPANLGTIARWTLRHHVQPLRCHCHHHSQARQGR